MLGQGTSRGQVADGIAKHGVAPGGRKMIDREEVAAQTSLYISYRNRDGTDCTRVGPGAKCFCGCKYEDHAFATKKSVYPHCQSCACKSFRFVPQRPEEVGDWWLPRRKGFNVHTWRAKCRCGHGHDEHDANSRRCKCGCGMFTSNFACVVCDLKWEDHETVFETGRERAMEGRPTGDAYFPLANDSQIRDMVFPGGGAKKPEGTERYRPQQVDQRFAEKSVQISHASSGGAIRDQQVANRWGQVEGPPEEWLYQGGGRGPGGTRSPGGMDSLPARPGSMSVGAPGVVGRAAGMAGRSTASVGNAGRRPAPVPSSQQQAPEPKATSSGFRPVYD
eukprot:gene2129-18175_t